MQKIANRVFYSATDLTHFAECQHLTWLDRVDLDEPMARTEDDDQAKLIQSKGLSHEKVFLDKLRATSESCVEIDSNVSLEERIANTRAAILDGAEVIYQATLNRDNLIGHADFLKRVEKTGGNGRYHYEVIDTKLARSAKAKFILQLCFYSDLLSDLTGRLPSHMHVELGSGRRESFRLADYFYYYRHLLSRFLKFAEGFREIAPPYPAPCDFCSLCHWRERCEAKREADNHLSAVANITRQQISHLEAAEIRTVAHLASITAGVAVRGIADQTYAKLRGQAALQVEERETGQQKVVVLPHAEDETRGFARLPVPDAGDIFFDMEGDPMEDGGLEYLFGLYYFEDRMPVFKCFWAHNREQERQAFIDFMDFVTARRNRFPGMHIYHYAHYENTALKRLMSLHGVRESDVDQLLREGRLVDLYKVVREGLRISKPSYSIKAVESFYADKRTADVKKATDSIVVYERWRETGNPELLESIRQYNEDDCRSTWQLREWLLTLRPAGVPWFRSIAASKPDKTPTRKKSDKTIELEEKLAHFHQRLIAHPENPDLDPVLAELVYYLLDFHRRADKPVWWSLFDRQQADFEDLIDDPDVIAGLRSPEAIAGGDRYEAFRYRYPEQDFKARAGDYAKRLDTLQDVRILDVDEDARTVDMELRPDENGEPPASLAVSIGAPVKADSIRNALFSFAESLLQGEKEHKALLDYLSRAIPDIDGIRPGDSIVKSGGNPLSEIVNVANRLNDSYLFIQGPPGAGKTFTGSHVIASLLRAGKRIAVSSNSHKAIGNLLEAVDKRMKEAGATYAGMKKCSKKEQAVESEFIENVFNDKLIIDGRPQLAAGTAWLFSKTPLWRDFDYLFIDEAGQVSLANMIAMGMCARNVILLGDQMQLGQPIQGTHPGRSGESTLDYLLNGEATIAPDRGIFLEKTYRMHPDVCSFISDAIYDSRLKSDSSTLRQRLILNDNAHPVLRPTGIRHIPVEHDGCSQRSEEEARLVREIVDNLLTQRYRDKQGLAKPITLNDILVVAPYNMQVNLLKRTLPEGARVGTVDKFQGQEAEAVIVSMTTSSAENLPRFMGFLYSRNRLNVAVSRARCLAILIASPALNSISCVTPGQMTLVNIMCRIGNWNSSGD